MLASQTKKAGTKTYQFKLPFFVASYLFLWIFFALNDVGADTQMYRGHYQQFYDFSTTTDNYASVEIGYQYLNIILHAFTDDEFIGVILIRTIQLTLIFISFYLLRNKIIIGYGLLAYISLYYFQSFNLLRSSTAGAICLLSFVMTYRDKRLLGILLAALAYTIHQSSLLFFVTLIAYHITTLFKKHTLTIQIIAICTMLFILMIGKNLIIFFLSKDFGGGRYDLYDVNSASFGLLAFIEYTPILFLIFKCRTRSKNQGDLRWWNLCFIYAIAGFMVALLSYNSGILTRAAIYFSSSFLFFIPYVLRRYPDLFLGLQPWIGKTIIWVYYSLIFTITISGLYEPSQLIPFEFI